MPKNVDIRTIIFANVNVFHSSVILVNHYYKPNCMKSFEGNREAWCVLQFTEYCMEVAYNFREKIQQC